MTLSTLSTFTRRGGDDDEDDDEDMAAAAAAAAIEKEAAENGFTMPPKIVPRAPKSLSNEQLSQPVFFADDFGDAVAADGTAGGLVFPSSFDKDSASIDDLFEAADAALAAAGAAEEDTAGDDDDDDQDDGDDSTGYTMGKQSDYGVKPKEKKKKKDPFDVVNELPDDPFVDEAAAEEIDLNDYPEGSYIVTDWKGDPMVITPGDRIPGVM